jgi:hypothetical protein
MTRRKVFSTGNKKGRNLIIRMKKGVKVRKKNNRKRPVKSVIA